MSCVSLSETVFSVAVMFCPATGAFSACAETLFFENCTIPASTAGTNAVIISSRSGVSISCAHFSAFVTASAKQLIRYAAEHAPLKARFA